MDQVTGCSPGHNTEFQMRGEEGKIGNEGSFPAREVSDSSEDLQDR